MLYICSDHQIFKKEFSSKKFDLLCICSNNFTGLFVAPDHMIKMVKFFYLLFQKTPRFLIPYLIVNCITIIGGIASILLILFKGSDGLDASDESNLIATELDEHKTLFIICAISAILLNCYTWLVIFTLHQQYTHLMVGGRIAAVILGSVHPNVAFIEHGLNSKSRDGHPSQNQNKNHNNH